MVSAQVLVEYKCARCSPENTLETSPNILYSFRQMAWNLDDMLGQGPKSLTAQLWHGAHILKTSCVWLFMAHEHVSHNMDTVWFRAINNAFKKIWELARRIEADIYKHLDSQKFNAWSDTLIMKHCTELKNCKFIVHANIVLCKTQSLLDVCSHCVGSRFEIFFKSFLMRYKTLFPVTNSF